MDTTHFAIVGPDNNFQVGCETFWPAIFNQYACSTCSLMHDMSCKQTSGTAVILVNAKICCLMTHDLHSAVLVCTCLIFQPIPASCTCFALLHLDVMLPECQEKTSTLHQCAPSAQSPRYLWPSLLPCTLEICLMSNSGMQMGGARGSHRCTSPLCCLTVCQHIRPTGALLHLLCSHFCICCQAACTLHCQNAM